MIRKFTSAIAISNIPCFQNFQRRFIFTCVVALTTLVVWSNAWNAWAQLNPAPGFTTSVIASKTGTTASFGGLLLSSLEYNPVTDTWLTINGQGFDDIMAIKRDGTFANIASSFGLGDLGRDRLAVTTGNLGWVAEGHARSIYKLVPATFGASKILLVNLPGDPNGSSCPEDAVVEADGNGDLIVGFGPNFRSAFFCAPAQPGAPRNWFRVTSSGAVTPLFSSTNTFIEWLKRDPITGTFFGIDTFDATVGGFSNVLKPRLVTLDVTTGDLTVIKQYLGFTLSDPEVDRTKKLVTSDVIWADKNQKEIVPIDPSSGAVGSPIVTLNSPNPIRINGLALAPSTSIPNSNSLYVLVSEVIGSTVIARLIEIKKAQQSPIAANDSYSVNEDTTLNVSAPGVLGNDTDVDGDALTAVLVTAPSNGTLTLSANGSFTYTPNLNFNGTDAVSYKANDGMADSNVATVTVIVTPVNDPPNAVDDTTTVAEDSGANAIDVLANDSFAPDAGEILTVIAVTQGTNGSVAIAGGGTGVSYIPNANFNGTDNFTYTISDGNGGTDIAAVAVTVIPVNDPPLATSDSYSTDEDTALAVAAPGVLANDNDVDGNPLTAVLVSGATNGTLTLNSDGSFAYTPNSSFSGADNFSYKANDGTSDSNVATVTITVKPAPLSPVQATQNLDNQVQNLVNQGVLDKGNSNALSVKLQAAIEKINQGNNKAAINQLQAFINQVEAFIKVGRLSQADGQQLIAAANKIINQLTSPAAPGLTSFIPAIPADFALGQNHPNPFNPETWIPYRLAKDVEVRIRIYNTSGALIRALDLGQKMAGFYASKDQAAYWDGRNNRGEQVGSGIYFYTIQAGEFTATRKMILLK